MSLSEKPVKEKLTSIFYVSLNNSIFEIILVTQSLTRGIYAEKYTHPGTSAYAAGFPGCTLARFESEGGRGVGGG